MIYATQIHGTGSLKEQEYLAGWQRARAELNNLQQRNQNEREREQQKIKRAVIESLISLADNFQDLAQQLPPALRQDSWAQGVGHVARQFEKLLQEQGVELINPTGDEFDPSLHEAVGSGEAKTDSGLVTEVVQRGYKINDLVIRPAKVKVSV